MKDDVENIKVDVGIMRSSMDDMKSEMKVMRTDIRIIKYDLGNKAEKEDLGSLRKRVSTLENRRL